MKALVICFLSLSFFGCAALQRATSVDGLSNKERKQKLQEEEREIRRLEEAHAEAERNALLVPGQKIEKIKAVWGEPSDSAYTDGALTLNYSDLKIPMYLVFIKGRLELWEKDKAEIARREVEKTDEAILRLERENRKEEMWRGIGNAFSRNQPPKSASQILLEQEQKKTTCTSRSQFDGSVQTVCD